jgi:hypothetical protein
MQLGSTATFADEPTGFGENGHETWMVAFGIGGRLRMMTATVIAPVEVER